MATLMGILAVGTVWFWVLMAVSFGLFATSMVKRSGYLATITLVATFTALGFLGDFNILKAIQLHPVISAMAITPFFLIGMVWSVVRTRFYTTDASEKRTEKKRKWLINTKGVAEDTLQGETVSIPDEHLADWREYEGRDYNDVPKMPTLSDIMRHVGFWATYWPIDMAVFFLGEFVQRASRWCVQKMRGIYLAVIKSAWKGHDDDNRPLPPPPPKTEGQMQVEDDRAQRVPRGRSNFDRS